MYFQMIVLIFILLLTLYLATQGAFSALCLLAGAIFASVLAMGIYQWAAGPLLSRQPDYAYGIGFFLVFLLGFLLMREVFDRLVRFDVILPPWPNRIAGGAIGFIAAMVIIGSTVLGIEMMPMPTTILGYNRYPDGMGRASSGLWLDPDGFVTGIWNMAGGKSLGGPTVFARMNPSFNRQLYGYRHSVRYDGWKTLPQNLLKVVAMKTLDSASYGAEKVPSPGGTRKMVLVRTRVLQGSSEPDVSADAAGGTNYLFLTPTQLRLVTTGGHQYYPIGYLKNGLVFHPLTLRTPVVDDYRKVHGHRVVYQDWIFKIRSADKPILFEMKSTASVNLLTAKISKKFTSLAVKDYPQHPYNNATIAVNISSTGLHGPYEVCIVPSGIQMVDIQSEVHNAYNRLNRVNSALINHAASWSMATEKIAGSPNTTSVEQLYNQSITYNSYGTSQMLGWTQILPVVLASQIGHDTAECLLRVGNYFTTTIAPILRSQQVYTTITDAQGAFPSPVHIAPADYTVIAWRKTGRALRIWMKDVTIKPADTKTLTLGSGDLAASYSR